MSCRIEFNAAEAVRYMGAKRGDAAALLLAEEAYFHLRNEVQPRHLLIPSSMQSDEEKGSVILADGTAFHSYALARHLRDCEAVLLLAATLGAKVDAAVRRLSIKRIALGAAAQAVGAALIETYCDDVTAAYAKEKAANFILLSRFSPGYGDWDLKEQSILCRRLATEKIGLTLTAGLMLAPTKSVTAVIGLRKSVSLDEETAMNSEKKKEKNCAACAKTDCPFRI